MLAAAEPIGGHFSVFHKASLVSRVSDQETPMLFVLSSRWDWRGRRYLQCGGVCLFRAINIILIFFFIKIESHRTYTMGWQCPSVFPMAAVSVEACYSVFCMERTWHQKPLKKGPVYCKLAYHQIRPWAVVLSSWTTTGLKTANILLKLTHWQIKSHTLTVWYQIHIKSHASSYKWCFSRYLCLRLASDEM